MKWLLNSWPATVTPWLVTMPQASACAAGGVTGSSAADAGAGQVSGSVNARMDRRIGVMIVV